MKVIQPSVDVTPAGRSWTRYKKVVSSDGLRFRGLGPVCARCSEIERAHPGSIWVKMGCMCSPIRDSEMRLTRKV